MSADANTSALRHTLVINFYPGFDKQTWFVKTNCDALCSASNEANICNNMRGVDTESIYFNLKNHKPLRVNNTKIKTLLT